MIDPNPTLHRPASRHRPDRLAPSPGASARAISSLTIPMKAETGNCEQLRIQGRTDDQIAGMIEQAVGVKLAPEAISRFYALPEEQGRYGE